MATWRCPHCGTPQPETARCWVCSRSSMTCATCLHFRAGVAVRLGTCGLDPRRGPLRGDETWPCWSPRAELSAPDGGLFEVTIRELPR